MSKKYVVTKEDGRIILKYTKRKPTMAGTIYTDIVKIFDTFEEFSTYFKEVLC